MSDDLSREAAKAFFSAPQTKMVQIASELIIPTTDTPGAIAAGVPAFIEMMVSQWYTQTERDIFLEGLGKLDQLCIEQGGSAFTAATEEVQIQALLALEKAGKDHPGTSPMAAFTKQIDETTPFFHKLKELTILGYYTSEVGAKQEHSYNPMPMKFIGDYPYADVGRQWSS